MNKNGSQVYVYRFTHWVPGTGAYEKYHAFHTGEVPYALDNLQFSDRPWQKADHDLAAVMSNYWANFVKTGNPNGNHLPDWRAYNAKQKEVMMLGDAQYSTPLKDAAQLDCLYSIKQAD
jgi:para-nitrobenzyl esterase